MNPKSCHESTSKATPDNQTSRLQSTLVAIMVMILIAIACFIIISMFSMLIKGGMFYFIGNHAPIITNITLSKGV